MKLSMSMAKGPVFAKTIAKAGKNLGEVMAYTLTNCAFEGRAKLQRDMGKYIHKPTGATTRGVYYTQAKKNTSKPFSEVKFSPLAWKWMRYSVLGGQRSGPTLTAPVAAKKNAYGNVVAAQRAKNILTGEGGFRATLNGTDGVWKRDGRKLSLMHVYKPSLQYRSRLPMQKIVYDEATRVFKAKFKQNVTKALKRSSGLS